MYDFCIDTVGDGDENKKKKATGNNSVQFSDVAKVKQISDSKKLNLFNDLPKLSLKTDLKRKDKKLDLSDTYLVTNYNRHEELPSSNINSIMSKSSIRPGLEKEHAIPLLEDKFLKLQRKKLREQTKGENWYNIPATPITDEIKNDLQVLQMRSVLNKNQFYKKNDIKEISKYFHIGTVVEGAADFYSGRIVKSKRRKTLVDELLADAEFKNYQKKKYKEIMNLDIRKRRAQSKMPQKQNAIEKQAKKQGKVKKKTKD